MCILCVCASLIVGTRDGISFLDRILICVETPGLAAIVFVSRPDLPFVPVLFVSIGRQPVGSLQIHWLDLIDVLFVSFPFRNPRGVATILYSGPIVKSDLFTIHTFLHRLFGFKTGFFCHSSISLQVIYV